MTLEAWVESGNLSWLDLHLSRALTTLGRVEGEEAQLVVALLSSAVRGGHVCLDLAHPAATLQRLGFDLSLDPRVNRGFAALRASELVSDGSEHTPLVLDFARRLYLRRYWEYEQFVLRALRERASQVEEAATPDTLRPLIERLFPPDQGAKGEPDWQMAAALIASRRRFCVITGGPGTGKTYTAARVLALLLEVAKERGQPAPRIALAAPTGKAAARLAQTIGEARDHLASAVSMETCSRLPAEASTIHRLLRPIGGSDARFVFCADHPLLADVVVVDECSMVDLALFAHLLAAVPPHARLILLGDEHQLASVEAGAVLGDICDRGRERGYSAEQAAWLERASGGRLAGVPLGSSANTPLADCIVRLKRNYRFRGEGGIGALARAINRGDSEEAWRLLEKAGAGDAIGLAPPAREREIRSELREAVRKGFAPYLRKRDPGERLEQFEQYRVLCPHRHGPAGVSFLNRQIEACLARANLIRPYAAWYDGRPVLVTENSYALRLFNGDIGVVTERSGEGRGPQVAFRTASGELRFVPPIWLPAHQTAFAMTIHKSQGSEFECVDVVLPQQPGPLLTRELLYTAITRAKQRVVLHSNREVFVTAVRQRVERSSGLRDGLWGASGE